MDDLNNYWSSMSNWMALWWKLHKNCYFMVLVFSNESNKIYRFYHLNFKSEQKAVNYNTLTHQIMRFWFSLWINSLNQENKIFNPWQCCVIFIYESVFGWNSFHCHVSVLTKYEILLVFRYDANKSFVEQLVYN